jgi:hypothetical protein
MTPVVPVEQGIPARAKVTSLPDGSWTLAFALDGGRRVEPFGEPFRDVRAACRAAAALNERIGQ